MTNPRAASRTQHPTSRYLARLDEQIAAAGSTVDADCLRAEKAAYLARQGRREEAEGLITAVQLRYSGRPRAEISTRVNLAQAMIEHFGQMKPTARDRVLRAQALAAASGLNELDALSSAWLAQLDYGRNDFVSMERNLRRSLSLANSSSHLVLERAYMVAGQAFHFAGHYSLARPWYDACHRQITALGDDASLSALFHNTAWAHLVNLRHARFSPERRSVDEVLALMTADSTGAYDTLTSVASLQLLTPLLRAQLFSLTGRWMEALQLFEKELPDALGAGLGQWYPTMLADSAVCRVAVGDFDAARADAYESEARIDARGHPDDLGAVHARLASAFESLREPDRAAQHEVAAITAWQAHEARQELILRILSGLAPIDNGK